MSKFFAAILAFFVMVLSWFGINIGNNNNHTQPVTVPTEIVTEAETTTEPTTEPATEPTTEPATEPTTEPDDGTVRANTYKTNVALYKTYKKDRDAHQNYPDSYLSELTDGEYAYSQYASYSNASFSGYTRLWEKNLKIDVDLENVTNKLYEFKLSYLATAEAGINIPLSVSIYISNDEQSWTKAGEAIIPQQIDGSVHSAVLTLNKYVSAQYVRFSVYGDSAWVFIDEVIVTADIKSDDNSTDFYSAINSAYAEFGAPKAPKTENAVNTSLNKISVSKNKSYEISKSTVAPFNDNGIVLTDGSYNNTYQSGAYAGLKSDENQTVTIFLGEAPVNVDGIEVFCLAKTPAGIYFPSAIRFSAVNEDGTKTLLGVRYADLNSQSSLYVFKLNLDYTVAAKSIEIELAKTECARMYLLDEINVFKYEGNAALNEPCYPDIDISLQNNGAWSEASADFNTYQNLLLGLPSQITAQGLMSEDQNSRNTKASSGLLTDGIHAASTNIYSGSYQIFYTCRSRQVVFDLCKVSSVNKFVCEFTNQTDWGVYAPKTVNVYLSQNGSQWYCAGEAEVDTTKDPSVTTGTLLLTNEVKARYVCYEFKINVFAGCSELEAFGTKNTNNAMSLKDAGFNSVQLFNNQRILPSDSFLDGAKDTCLLYHSKSFGYTPEQLLCYTGYTDKDGNITDTMFDSFLFLMSGPFPSGLDSFSDAKLTDWQWCIDDLFTENENIFALEQAAGTVKQALGLPDNYVYPFTVAVYCPNVLRTDFGDIDGDGINEDFSTDEGRIKALNAYADMFESRLNACNFKNIKFSGYYWMKESMDTQNRDDYVARAFSDYVHERGYNFFWIPYYKANGFNTWQSYGFDCAVLQPNYVFSLDAPYSKLTKTASLTKLYGLGIEMELSGACFTSDEYFSRYMKYLSDGAKYGYMNDTVVMYYQELTAFYRGAHSSDGKGRLIYDNTYAFIKGTLNPQNDVLSEQSFSCTKNTVLKQKLNLPQSPWHNAVLISEPKNGTVTLSPDGSFCYYPEKDFTGEVTFGFTYTTSFNMSPECKVKINVTP